MAGVGNVKSEQADNTGRVNNFDSVGWHLVTNEIEGEVDILEEEGDGEQTVEELAWGIILEDLHPHLLLFAVSTLHKVVGVTEVHVVWPHAAEFVTSMALLTLDMNSGYSVLGL